MTWNFADGFDLYAAPADPFNGYWDGAGGNSSMLALVAGRFAGSRAINLGFATGAGLVKTSGVNDAVHHLVVAYSQGASISGTFQAAFLELMDGATAQCTITFRSDGVILLQSGAPGGTTLATYSAAFSASNTWYAFEFEVVINSTTGSFAVRRNGNTVNDFTATGLNTRPTSTNNYANRLTVGTQNQGVNSNLDDLFWQSGAATGAWLGDIRCYTRMPASDVQNQFSHAPSTFFAQGNAGASTAALAANTIYAFNVTAPFTGMLTSLQTNLNVALTGHMKMALYDATGSGGGAGALMAQSAAVTNPPAGVNVFPVTGGPTVTKGVTYWVAFWADAAPTGTGTAQNYTDVLALTYTTNFPSTLAGFSLSSTAGTGSSGMTVTGSSNSAYVNEPQQDGLTSYLYDNNPGDADFYGLAGTAGTPAAVIATTIRGYMQKSDAGTRSAAIQLKSGATTVAALATVLSTAGFQWVWRTDLNDPNTGAPWAPSSVNVALIGPTVVS